MRFLLKNFHVLAFAFLAMTSAIWVARSPERTTELVRPLVEDARELKSLALRAYGEIETAGVSLFGDEAVALYTATLRMPSMLFERLSDRLSDIDRALKEGRSPEPGLGKPARGFRRLPVGGSETNRAGHGVPAPAAPLTIEI